MIQDIISVIVDFIQDINLLRKFHILGYDVSRDVYNSYIAVFIDHNDYYNITIKLIYTSYNNVDYIILLSNTTYYYELTVITLISPKIIKKIELYIKVDIASKFFNIDDVEIIHCYILYHNPNDNISLRNSQNQIIQDNTDKFWIVKTKYKDFSHKIDGSAIFAVSCRNTLTHVRNVFYEGLVHDYKFTTEEIRIYKRVYFINIIDELLTIQSIKRLRLLISYVCKQQ